MERLDFTKETKYSAIEAAIHLNRYAIAKTYCKGASVLDAACGEGYGSYLMKKWGAKSVEGIDLDKETIEKARSLFKADNLQYSQHDVQTLPYEDNTFDLIVSLETMEHVDSVESFLKEIKRVIKPDGVIILSCPNDKYYYERDNMEKNPFHKREYTFFEFKELAEKYLGSFVNYYLGFALDGFINLPYERRTEPESSLPEDALGMFHYTQCEETFCVPQERYLNQWNSNYYIGIWGKSIEKYNAVIAPRETFIDHKDKDYDLLYHLDEIRDSNNKLKEELSRTKTEKAELIKLKEELSRIETEKAELNEYITQIGNGPMIELDRIRMLLDLTQKERDQAQFHMNQNWNYYQNVLKEKEELQNEYENVIKEKNKMQDEYEHMIEEREGIWKEYCDVSKQLEETHNSKCFRLLRTIDKLLGR